MTKLFGRSYETVGSSDADFLIKTRGQVKLQIGNKFVDLVSGGKLVNNTYNGFIYQQDTVGDKNGIYILPDNKVVIKFNETQINLGSEEGGDSYISFLDTQDLKSEEKYLALTNIGFLYNDWNDWNTNGLQNGIIYLESELKLYTVLNGNPTEYTFSITPYFTELVIIEQTGYDSSLLIKGTGQESGILFDNVYIYNNEDGGLTFDTDHYSFNINGEEVFKVDNYSTVFTNNVESSMFKSPNANDYSGFRLYTINGESTLEVDNLIVRNQENDNSLPNLYPTEWFYKRNIIKEAEQIDETSLQLTLYYTNEFVIGDELKVYIDNTDYETEEITLLALKFTITNIKGNVLTVNSDYTDDTSVLVNKVVFDVTSDKLLSISKNNIQIGDDVKLGDFTFEFTNDSVNTIKQGVGIHSKVLAVDEAMYVSGYLLSDEDNSSRLSSTEWVKRWTKLYDTIESVDKKISDTKTWVTNNHYNKTDIDSTVETINNTITTGLATKSDIGHGHVISDITDLQSTLDSKAKKNHASDTTDYGIATTSLYGHIKLGSEETPDITVEGTAAPSFHKHSLEDLTKYSQTIHEVTITDPSQWVLVFRIRDLSNGKYQIQVEYRFMYTLTFSCEILKEHTCSVSIGWSSDDFLPLGLVVGYNADLLAIKCTNVFEATYCKLTITNLGSTNITIDPKIITTDFTELIPLIDNTNRLFIDKLTINQLYNNNGNYQYTLPEKSGTLALINDIPTGTRLYDGVVNNFELEGDCILNNNAYSNYMMRLNLKVNKYTMYVMLNSESTRKLQLLPLDTNPSTVTFCDLVNKTRQNITVNNSGLTDLLEFGLYQDNYRIYEFYRTDTKLTIVRIK